MPVKREGSYRCQRIKLIYQKSSCKKIDAFSNFLDHSDFKVKRKMKKKSKLKFSKWRRISMPTTASNSIENKNNNIQGLQQVR